jgi:hypothetical protein
MKTFDENYVYVVLLPALFNFPLFETKIFFKNNKGGKQ